MAIKLIVAENEVKTRLDNYDVTAETTDRSLQTESQTKVNQRPSFFQETENQTKVSQKAVIFFPAWNTLWESKQNGGLFYLDSL